MSRAEAFRQGKLVKSMMKSKGWSVHVWNNCGWHVKLIKDKGHFSLNWSTDIMTDNPSGFWTLLSGTHAHAGETYWTPYGKQDRRFKDPNRAVANQIRLAKQFVSYCQQVIDRASK